MTNDADSLQKQELANIESQMRQLQGSVSVANSERRSVSHLTPNFGASSHFYRRSNKSHLVKQKLIAYETMSPISERRRSSSQSVVCRALLSSG